MAFAQRFGAPGNSITKTIDNQGVNVQQTQIKSKIIELLAEARNHKLMHCNSTDKVDQNAGIKK